MGPDMDPYHETIPEEDLHFYQRKGAKRKRKLPEFIPAEDLKILNSVKRKAYRLDLQLSICGFRLGWAGIIGLIPWIGDMIAGLLALQLVRKAEKILGGLPQDLRARMMANVAFDFGIGLIPLVGDFINVLYKCNSRNFVLLEKHLVEKHRGKIMTGGNLGKPEPIKSPPVLAKARAPTEIPLDKSKETPGQFRYVDEEPA